MTQLARARCRKQQVVRAHIQVCLCASTRAAVSFLSPVSSQISVDVRVGMCNSVAEKREEILGKVYFPFLSGTRGFFGGVWCVNEAGSDGLESHVEGHRHSRRNTFGSAILTRRISQKLLVSWLSADRHAKLHQSDYAPGTVKPPGQHPGRSRCFSKGDPLAATRDLIAVDRNPGHTAAAEPVD